MGFRASVVSLFGVVVLLFSSVSGGQIANRGGGGDESTALSNSKFTSPIILRLGADGFARANDLKTKDYSGFMPSIKEPCVLKDEVPVAFFRYVRSDITNYANSVPNIDDWLRRNRFYVESATFKIKYNVGVTHDFVCPIVNESVRKYLPSGQTGNVHNGLEIPIGRRVLSKWTYRNRYDTPLPGKGNVKVFAGTFTYNIESLVPVVSFSGEGTASVKLFLDPDNGVWTVQDWKMQDPNINLLVSPLGGQGSADAQDAPPGQMYITNNGCKSLLGESLGKGGGTATWSGECLDGYAEGTGVRALFDSSQRLVGIWKGRMSHGKFFYEEAVRWAAGDSKLTYTKNPNIQYEIRKPEQVPDWARALLLSNNIPMP